MIAALLGVLLSVPSGAAGSPPCPNEDVRTGYSANLPECRAYERVSPIDKGSLSINTITSPTFRPSPDGNNILYYSGGGYPGATSSVYVHPQFGSRSAETWSSRSAELPWTNTGSPVVGLNLVGVSEDATQSVGWTPRALAPGAVEGGFNVYRQNNATGDLTFIFTTPNSLLNFGQLDLKIGGTPSYDRILIYTKAALTPDAIANESLKLYEFTAGDLRLASYVPSDMGDEPSPDTVDLRETGLDTAISEDGSRVLFSLSGSSIFPGDLGLYMRINGTHTVPISASQRTGDDETVRSGLLKAASQDGQTVYFASNERLTDASAPFDSEPSSQFHLYRYDVNSGVLTDSSQSGDPLPPLNYFQEFVGVSADGSAAFFRTSDRLYYWKGSEVRLIATGLTGEMLNNARTMYKVSPSGRFIAFIDRAQLTGYDNSNPRCEEVAAQPLILCQQVFLYDAQSKQLECVSCRRDGGPSQGHAAFGWDWFDQEPISAVTDDGKVFFTTPDRLVANDSNGQRDVYMAYAGERHLISSGVSDYESLLTGVSETGDDVFFTTSQPLVAQDTDGVPDLYDARVGGGLASQGGGPTQQCAGEGCQPAASAPPPSQQIASQAASASPQKKARRSGKRCRNPRRHWKAKPKGDRVRSREHRHTCKPRRGR